MPVRKVFISYARQNKPDVEQLVEHLRVLGCDTWHDSSLHGGQDWWEEILRRIADCDTFIAIISRDALNSTACRREFDWAESLGKPVLPVALEPPPKALPRRFSTRQIVDYSDRESRGRAALTLAGGLATLPAAPPPPDPLPGPPAAPLSYLTDLVDLVSQPEPLDHDQQRDILNQLEPALYSVDPEERRGGHDILEMLSSRGDLYADVYRTINRLKDMGDSPASGHSSDESTTDSSPVAVTADLSASTLDTIVGEDVAPPEKTTQQGKEELEHTFFDEQPAAEPQTAPAREVADRSGNAKAELPQGISALEGDVTRTPAARSGQERTESPTFVPESSEAETKSASGQAPTALGDSSTPDAGILFSTDTALRAGDSDAPKSGSSTSTGDRRGASVPPTATTPTEPVPLFQRWNRRTKLVTATIAAVVAVLVTVAIIVGSQSSSDKDASRATSTTGSPALPTTTIAAAPPATSATGIDPRLQRFIPGDLKGCTPGDSSSFPSPTIVAGATCALWISVGYGDVYFRLFRDQDSFDDDFNTWPNSHQLQPCPGLGQSPQTWAQGKLACVEYSTSSGTKRPQVWWTFGSDLVEAHIEGPVYKLDDPVDGQIDPLYQWWLAHYH